MSAHMRLCNFTGPQYPNSRKCRSAERPPQELGKMLGVDIKAGYLAIRTYDLTIRAESASDDAMAKLLLSLASKANVPTTTVKVHSGRI